LATPRAFRRNPELVWQFYAWRRGRIAAGEPNKAHHLLVEIEEAVPAFHLVTQNVDGYHTQAGNENVIELHGCLWRLKCIQCDHQWEDRRDPLPVLPPRCPECENLARPDVVWFGEHLHPPTVELAVQYASEASIFLSIGTSSVVYPAAELPVIARQHGAYTVEINPEETPISHQMDEVRRGLASIELQNWWKESMARFGLLDPD
jgi:NAD-dependent deacetylase